MKTNEATATATATEATATATLLTVEEYNATMEREAKKRLTDALFRLYNGNREAFVKELQFNEKNAVEAFTTEYIGKDENGNNVTLTAKVKFTVFSLLTDENDAKRIRRNAIRDNVEAIAKEASATPTKQAKSKAVENIKDAYRLLGFSEYADKVNATDAKRILCNAYRLTDNGKDDARKNEVKRSLQAILCRMVNGKEATNAMMERETKKNATEATATK